MKILIIEDEIKTAKSLARLIQSAGDEIEILDILQSIKSTVAWFRNNEQPDLIFMDIQLADGLSFEIFEAIKIVSPIIFCTAFNEYAVQAFKNNGIDYILKPFNKNDIQTALDKVKNLRNYFQNEALSTEAISKILKSLNTIDTKQNFLVYSRNAYINIPTSSIAYFYKSLSGIHMVTDDKKKYSLNESLDEIHRMVGRKSFFRINRQYLIAFKRITEVQHYFERKLIVTLNQPTEEKLIVGREKAGDFLEWLRNR